MRHALISHLAALVFAAAAFAQSTAVTYQGDLKQAGQSASGPYDMRFKLFDAASGGTQLGSTLCLNNVPVTDGKFSTTIDCGQQFASTASRFLEIDVRADFGSPCTDVLGYVTVTPRQLIIQAPRAQAANVANALVPPGGPLANAVVVDNDGKIGIGTAAPTHSVHIAKPAPTLAIQDTNSDGLPGGQQVGYLSYRDNGNAERALVGYATPGDPDFTVLNARTSGDIVLNTFGGGKVGIGTASPLAALDVRGDIRLGSLGEKFATVGDENFRVIRGRVFPTADCTFTPSFAGSGFTVTNLSCGEMRINFSQPFAATPVVFASAPWGNVNGGESHFVTCSSVTPAGVSIRVFLTNDGNNVRNSFHFIAVGRR